MFRTVTHKAVCLVSKSGRVSMMLTRTTQLAAPTSLLVGASFTTLSHKHKAPGSDPLQVLQKECLARNLCDPDGGRLPGSHWVFCIAIAHTQAHQPPSLRTIGIERMSSSGIDFVMKKGHPTAETLMNGQPISFLHTQGRYLPGEKAEQWRGHGVCRSVPLATVLDLVPHFTITSMVGSRRVTHELAETPHDKDVSEGHLAIASKVRSKIVLFIVSIVSIRQRTFSHSLFFLSLRYSRHNSNSIRFFLLTEPHDRSHAKDSRRIREWRHFHGRIRC